MIPRIIEPRKFAQQGLRVAGDLPADDLPRLRASVLELGKVSADLQFAIAESKHRLVTGHVQADVSMVCQRCLDPVATQLSSDLALAMVWTQEDAKTLPSAYEPWVVPAEQGDLYDILEEELLLVLPLVAFHDYECIDRSLFVAGDAPEAEQTKQNNPFQVLATLKGSSKN